MNPRSRWPVRSFLATVAAGKTHGVGGEVGATQPRLSRSDDSISIFTPAALYLKYGISSCILPGMTSHEYFRRSYVWQPDQDFSARPGLAYRIRNSRNGFCPVAGLRVLC